MKCQKTKKCLLFLLSLFMSFHLVLCSCVGSYASTSSGSVGDDYVYTEEYCMTYFDALCRWVVKEKAIISDEIVGTWNNFTTWLDDNGHGDIWTQHPHSPIRVTNGIRDVEVPQPVLNVIQQYVIYQIQQYPNSYTQCYISSYTRINATQFQTYSQYATVQSLCEAHPDCYAIMYRTFSNPNYKYRIAFVPKNKQLFLYGTTNNGFFSTVYFAYNWSHTSNPASSVSGSECFEVQVNGTSSSLAVSNFSVSNLDNSTTVYYPGGSGQKNAYTLFSTLKANELVYVYSSINAFKLYNSADPQSFYLTSDGASQNMSDWTVGSGTINTGSLSTANSSYSNVVNNVQSGWTAEEVLKLVDKISEKSTNVSIGGGSSNDDDDDDDEGSGFWSKIGKAIKDLIGGIGEVVAGAVEGIVDFFLGSENETTGERSGGILGVIKSTLTALVDLVDTNFNDFLGSIFNWLPSEIVTCFSAILVISIFFAVLNYFRR